jgi:16S rRNA (cytidine1402-2'-O)-methyltransferase
MSGILYVVATPIGNLEDVTLRALRILREVSLIAAEDTRRTSKLLQHYSISTPTTSLHEHNEHVKTPGLLHRLRRGDSLAIVSDAGTPAVSDPGARLVAAAHEQGFPVRAVPGPSAVTAVVSSAGVQADGFTFLGFPPSRSNRRKLWFRRYADHDLPLVLYEAPHRVLATLSDLREELGDRRLAIGREITKIHELLAVRPISEWIAHPPPPLGEFVLLIFPGTKPPGGERPAEPARLAHEFWLLTENEGLGRRAAIREVAKRFEVSSRIVFAAIEGHPEVG